MKLSGKVKAIEEKEQMFNLGPKLFVRIRLIGGGDLTLSLTPAESRPFHIGRDVDIEVVVPRPMQKAGKKK
jgi:hypothetical protein